MIKNKTIKKYLDILDDRSRDILILRFGLDGNEPQTLEKVGEKYQITRERVRQIQFLALSMIDKEREKIRLTDEEIELIRNAMLFFDNRDGNIADREEDKIHHSAYEKLGKMYEEEENE